MKKPKKSSVLLIAVSVCAGILLCLSSLFAAKHLVLTPFYFSYTWAYDADFSEYAKEFELLKEYVCEQTVGEENVFVITHNKESGQIGLFSNKDDNYMEIPSDVEYALYVLEKHAFQYQNVDLECIRVKGESVSFCAEQVSYAVVFSPNTAPVYFFGKKTYTKEICDNWYHVSEKS